MRFVSMAQPSARVPLVAGASGVRSRFDQEQQGHVIPSYISEPSPLRLLRGADHT